MDKASDFESEDCEFESRRGRVMGFYFSLKFPKILSLDVTTTGINNEQMI